MSETRYQEGEELERLLAELDERHPGKVNVLSVSYPRSGGVMGFFARERVGVEYEIADEEPFTDHLTDLLSAAETADHELALHDAAVTDGESADQTNAEFASMLLEMARDKVNGRVQQTAPPRAASAERPSLPSFEPVSVPSLDELDGLSYNLANGAGPTMTNTATTGLSPVGAAPTNGAQHLNGSLPNGAAAPVAAPAPVEVSVNREALAGLGVPDRLFPAPHIDAYRAVAELSRHLPTVTLPTGRGVVIAVAGPRAEAVRWAETIRERVGLRPEDVVEPTTLLQAAEIRLSGESAIVLIDSTEDVDHLMPKPTPGAMLDELRPTQLWAVLDGSRKLSDLQHEVGALSVAPDALIVNRLTKTASPASVWQFGIPIAFMDGEPATPTRWAALLLDRLADAGV
jgi:hypothetical protein